MSSGMNMGMMASMHYAPMDAFMEDFADANAVLPTPATYDTLGLGQLDHTLGHRGGMGDPSMMGLDDLVSPFDLAEPGFFDRLTYEDMYSASEDGSSEFGEQPNIATDEVFAVEGMSEPVVDKPLSSSLGDNTLRMMKPRQGSEKRFSPFPGGAAMSPGRPRAPKAAASPSAPIKLSSSLPAQGIVMAPVIDSKRCACCGCSNTPMWRDGRDGQRLCNACGIRWQKYGICCANCHYVPRKLENNSGSCRRCQAVLPPPVPTRRRSSSTSSPSKPS